MLRFVAFVSMMLLLVGHSLAAEHCDPLPNFVDGDPLNAAELNTLNCHIAANESATTDPGGAVHMVDCDNGQTVQGAINMAHPGDTIEVAGTCSEMVSITLDRLTLDGSKASTKPEIQGVGEFTPRQNTPMAEGVITIDGARGVVIRDLVISKGPDGIFIKRGASAVIRGVIVRGNADDGIQLASSAFARIIDTTAEDNGDDGFAVFSSASATFRGTVESKGNGDDGLSVGLSSGAQVAGSATLTVQNNGNSATYGSDTFEGNVIGDGIHISDTSSVLVSPGATVVSTGNADDGISLSRASSFGAFPKAEDDPISITSSGNGNPDDPLSADGIAVSDLSVFIFNGSKGTLTVQNNARRGLNAVGQSRINCPRITIVIDGNGQPDSFSSGSNGSCAPPAP